METARTAALCLPPNALEYPPQTYRCSAGLYIPYSLQDVGEEESSVLFLAHLLARTADSPHPQREVVLELRIPTISDSGEVSYLNPKFVDMVCEGGCRRELVAIATTDGKHTFKISLPNLAYRYAVGIYAAQILTTLDLISHVEYVLDGLHVPDIFIRRNDATLTSKTTRLFAKTPSVSEAIRIVSFPFKFVRDAHIVLYGRDLYFVIENCALHIHTLCGDKEEETRAIALILPALVEREVSPILARILRNHFRERSKAGYFTLL